MPFLGFSLAFQGRCHKSITQSYCLKDDVLPCFAVDIQSHRKKLQEKTQENPYFTLNYKENSGFPGFFPGVFSETEVLEVS